MGHRSFSAVRVGLLLTAVGGSAIVGCGSAAPRAKDAPLATRAIAPPETTPTAAVGSTGSPACARKHPGVGPGRVGDGRTGSTVALVDTGTNEARTLFAYVADADDRALHTVDVASGRELAVTPLRGNPEQVMVLADGRVATTLRNEGLVEILEPTGAPGAMESRCVVSVPTEPIALAATPDDTALLVTSGWAHALTVLDAQSLAVRRTVDVPREPRSVVVTDDGRRAFVAHVVNATMSIVDLDREQAPRGIDLKMRQVNVTGTKVPQKLRVGCQGFALAKAIAVDDEGRAPPPPPVSEQPRAQNAPPPRKPIAPPPGPAPRNVPSKAPGRIFAPFVTVDPGDPQRSSSGYGAQGVLAAEVSAVSVIDSGAERSMTRSVLALPARGAPEKPDCLLPRAATYARGSLFVTCMGIDALLELDGRSADPSRAEARRWRVPGGPTGVAVDAVTGRAVVWSQFDRQLSVISLDEARPVVSIALSRGAGSTMTPELALGRALFHKTSDPSISKDGRACASCHPDGREDALTWSTPDGPRQTIMLAGRLAETAPYSWSGNNVELDEHVRQTFQRLEGSGMPDRERAALVAYIRTLAPPIAKTSPSGERALLVARGKELFHDASTQCATCHGGDASTDHLRHDVGSRAKVDRDPQFETPSLRFLSGTAPYFHDGRYATLSELLEATDGSMGHTAQLSRDDRAALAAFLETL